MWWFIRLNFTWSTRTLMQPNWRPFRTTFSIQWILVSRIFVWALPSRIFLSPIRLFQTWTFLRPILQKILRPIRRSRAWPWKWMIWSLSRNTSSLSGGCQQRPSLRFWIPTGQTTVAIRPLKQSWRRLIFQPLNSSLSCRPLMTNTWRCGLSWVVLTNPRLLWIWRLFLAATSGLMAGWMTWKFQMKSMPAR